MCHSCVRDVLHMHYIWQPMHHTCTTSVTQTYHIRTADEPQTDAPQMYTDAPQMGHRHPPGDSRCAHADDPADPFT